MFTIEELRKIDVKKIEEEISNTEKALYKVRFEVKTGQEKGHNKISANKKYITRMKTILQERQTEEAVKEFTP